jgi:DNA repair exonuclease SbcCD ATPase subunit
MAENHSRDSCPFREEIEKTKELAKDNRKEIERIMTGDWYSNQQLFEMIQELQNHIATFNKNFAKYNGLIEDRKEDRELLDQLHSKVEKIETRDETQKETNRNWGYWLPWGIALLLSIAKIIELWKG